MRYVDIISALPNLMLTEKMTIRDILIEQIGPPRPRMKKFPSERQMDKRRRKLLIEAIKRLRRKDEDGLGPG
jgi:hypothetical protein